jgi:hypothetical protein
MLPSASISPIPASLGRRALSAGRLAAHQACRRAAPALDQRRVRTNRLAGLALPANAQVPARRVMLRFGFALQQLWLSVPPLTRWLRITLLFNVIPPSHTCSAKHTAFQQICLRWLTRHHRSPRRQRADPPGTDLAVRLIEVKAFRPRRFRTLGLVPDTGRCGELRHAR